MRGKGVALVVLVVLVALLLPSTTVLAESKVSVYVNGKMIPAGVEPIIVNGRVMVPLRNVAEMLDAKVYWFADDSRIEVKKGFTSTELWVSERPFTRDYAIVNGKYQQLDTAPQLVDGRAYVPLRIIGEAVGAEVEWDGLTKTVIIQLTEPEELTGFSSSVRDSVYNTFNAKSLKFKTEGQLKYPRYPQVNVFKFNGELDRNGNLYLKGHFGGWFGEALYLNKRIFLKSILFNDLWVELEQLLGKGQVEKIEREKIDAEAQFKDLAYDCTTDLIRALGTPVIRTDEKINGILCKKITFIPHEKSEKAFNELKSAWRGADKVTLTLWIGIADQLVHKSDLRVDFTDAGNVTGSENPDFVQIIIELSDINQYLTVEEPYDFTLLGKIIK